MITQMFNHSTVRQLATAFSSLSYSTAQSTAPLLVRHAATLRGEEDAR